MFIVGKLSKRHFDAALQHSAETMMSYHGRTMYRLTSARLPYDTCFIRLNGLEDHVVAAVDRLRYVHVIRISIYTTYRFAASAVVVSNASRDATLWWVLSSSADGTERRCGEQGAASLED